MPSSKNKNKYVKLCMMLAKLWHITFAVKPWTDFVESETWSAEFSTDFGLNECVLPLTTSAYGDSVESAAKKLLTSYINMYGEKVLWPGGKIRSETELIAKYEFSYG